MSDTAAAELSAVTTAWADQWFDPGRALLWNPSGSFGGGVADLSVHLVPQSAWYALGLLQRRAAGDVERAIAVLDALCDLQYREPGTPWDGTFAQFAETPRPGAGAREWLDYDPNWRQFLSTTFLLVVADHEDAVGERVVARLRGAAALACQGEEAVGRLDASYTNIALMHAWLAVEAGTAHANAALVDRGHELALEIVARFERHGAFDEYNSPTYYGIDLFALGLWRGRSASDVLRHEGAALEAALWRDLAPFVHPGLRNICGPWTRTYGSDMERYVAAVAIPMWAALGRGAAPLPSFEGDRPVDHGHDLVLGPPVAAVGAVVPRDVAATMTSWGGPRSIERTIGARRVVTAHLDEHVMVGAEATADGLPAWHQYSPVTAHWRHPGGGVGALRLMAEAPVSATARPGGLTVEVGPASGATSADVVLWIDCEQFDPHAIGPRGGEVPGAHLALDGQVDGVSVLPFGTGWFVVVARPPAGAVLEIGVSPDL